MSGVIACGVGAQDGRYRCRYCGFTSDDLEDFATVMCWTCALGPGEDKAAEDPSCGCVDWQGSGWCPACEQAESLAAADPDPDPWGEL